MTARIARGSVQTARPKPKGRAPAGTKVPVTHHDAVPLPEFVRTASWWILGVMLGALALAVLVAMQIPQMAGRAIGEAVGQAGFTVQRYEIKGLDRMGRRYVDRVAEQAIGTAMPLVDLEATRETLLRFGWVKDARVSRRLPDTLVVDIVERTPAAVWQNGGKLSLVDSDGVVLEPVKLDAMPDLPLVIGPAANTHVTELARLTEAAPQLKPMLAGASWIGGRRWDLRFQSGETLSLPEGEAAAAKALASFAREDKSAQLLGRGFARFYMLIPGKLIVRLSRTPGESVPTMAPPPAANAKAPASGEPVDPNKTI